ncbi:hypothetical protein SAMN05421780_11914 [Flexibacter flexilis DSM 6793]|uniref:Uncharacterized protein n=1 Tax=Flexibacter flexilis DSM 6793 TaxID=927664 RepID=A0A1I1P1E6_9BACT|nr:hypothetical protein [Flexibacter flexilis]SFD00773.1 hypothetical protein SAMN05421780_11914 [Flexibacter flexilis DSM 6793]
MDELLAIKELLINDLISYEQALRRLWQLPKPWTTKHWEKMRSIHLKDACENCGSTTQPLVIQHTVQPTKFKEHYEKIMSSYRPEKEEEEISEELVYNYLKENSEIRNACPTCGVTTIR